jgi:phenylpropionate dioxygenase-like ring-hydroxylating dioxygenase large terminal subunit
MVNLFKLYSLLFSLFLFSLFHGSFSYISLLANILKIQPSPLTYKLLLDFSKSVLNNSPPRILFGTEMNINRITEYPKLDINRLTEQDKYDLQWYVIGTKTDFVINKPTKVTIWNKNYVVWRNENNTYSALDDVCTHKGASLSCGKINNDNVVCPYHGYEFNENGTLIKVPGICFQHSPIQDLSKFDIVEKNGWVYLNTYSDIARKNNNGGDLIENIFVEEEVEKNDSVVFLNMDFKCYSRILSENSLDVMHIGFVHTFGNTKRPNPVENHPPKLVGPNHYKTSYMYEAGQQSVARKVFGVKDLIVENEFILPHTTVARVIFGEYTSTVITFALPISEKKSRLFVKTYRNFWTNKVGDALTENMMYSTMLQDKAIVENIDIRFMEGKFNMKFDKLQNTYKTFYKKLIHTFGDNDNNEIINSNTTNII